MMEEESSRFTNGIDTTKPSELEEPEHRTRELEQPHQQVELTEGGIWDERAELHTKANVVELDTSPQQRDVEEKAETSTVVRNQQERINGMCDVSSAPSGDENGLIAEIKARRNHEAFIRRRDTTVIQH